MLLNYLYNIQEKTQTENGLIVTILLNPEHFVYQAHFPDNPITPGVYILQIGKEILAEHFNLNLSMPVIKNVKFLQILSPVLNKKATYNINWKILEDCFNVSIIVEYQSTVFVKINAIFREEV
jgi:3-hydroxyacyl-[acyl-carrier-protein] dehydratase